MRCDTPIHFLRFLLATERFPERRTKIEIVGNNRTVTMRRLHRFQGDFRRARGERAENAACVQPSSSLLAENCVPIDIAGLKIRNRGVTTVVGTGRRAHSKSPFREIQPIPCGTPDAVVRHPADVRLIDAPLIHEIL